MITYCYLTYYSLSDLKLDLNKLIIYQFHLKLIYLFFLKKKVISGLLFLIVSNFDKLTFFTFSMNFIVSLI